MTDADIPSVAAVSARAFFDDPLQAWALPDDSTRLAKLEAMFTLQTRVASLPVGECYTDESCSVACFWAPPRAWQPTSDVLAQLVPLRDILAEGLARFGLAMNAMHAVHPEEPHWYLQGLGTEPARQRQGLASAVLEPVLARCDDEGTAAYLESTKERNVAFYERHGWRVTGTIDLPEGGPRMWSMWRDPR
ncbi:MAG: acetyltransferase [Actinomycetia bacterium]|nr:acetyltransferase [Actinomycetes bacterium]